LPISRKLSKFSTNSVISKTIDDAMLLFIVYKRPPV
jgi:hypothetical protein